MQKFSPPGILLCHHIRRVDNVNEIRRPYSELGSVMHPPAENVTGSAGIDDECLPIGTGGVVQNAYQVVSWGDLCHRGCLTLVKYLFRNDQRVSAGTNNNMAPPTYLHLGTYPFPTPERGYNETPTSEIRDAPAVQGYLDTAVVLYSGRPETSVRTRPQ